MHYLLTVLIPIFLYSSLSHGAHLQYHHQSKAGIDYTVTSMEVQPYNSYDVFPIDEVLEATLTRCEELLPPQIQANHVIVYPEYGTTGNKVYKDRVIARQLSQIVPSVSAQVNPCLTYNVEDPQEKIMSRFSCIAAARNCYIVSHFIERVNCDDCEDNLKLYSTAVVFDRTGVVVASYRKFHMYDETALDAADSAQISTFTSDFGVTFGLIMSFDLMFESPAMELTSNVNEILMPFSWSGIMPFLTPVQMMHGWTVINSVNLIPGCYLKPSEGFSGCATFLNDDGYIGGIITIEDIIGNAGTMNITSVDLQLQRNKPSNKANLNDLVYKKDNLSEYTSVILKNTTEVTHIETCYNSFCCKLTYKIIEFSESDIMYYQLLAFDGVKSNTNDKKWKSQICGLVACTGEDIETCNEMPQDNSYTNNVKFSKLNLSANFNTPLILPLTMYESFYPITGLELIINNPGDDEYIATLFLSENSGDIVDLHTFALHSFLVDIE